MYPINQPCPIWTAPLCHLGHNWTTGKYGSQGVNVDQLSAYLYFRTSVQSAGGSTGESSRTA